MRRFYLLFLYGFHETLECFRILVCHFREHLAVQCYIFFRKEINECAVGKAEWTDARVNARGPEAAKIILLLAAVLECVFSRVRKHFGRLTLFLADIAAHALGAGEHILPALQFRCSSFDTHGGCLVTINP